MKPSGALALILLGAPLPAAAGPVGAADAHAVAATGFPGAFLSSARLALADDELFASWLLDAFQIHLQSVASMTVPRAVADYLEQSSTSGQGMSDLRAKLGRAALPPPQAASLLLAHALVRPEQFPEMLDGLEILKPGLGLHTAAMLRAAKGGGDKRLLSILRAAGAPPPLGKILTYGDDGRWAAVFDFPTAARAPSGAAPRPPLAEPP